MKGFAFDQLAKVLLVLLALVVLLVFGVVVSGVVSKGSSNLGESLRGVSGGVRSCEGLGGECLSRCGSVSTSVGRVDCGGGEVCCV